MALSIPFKGSGRFVAEREWSCPIHDHPQYHECDCEHCEVPLLPDCCEGGEWVDKIDADGNVVMRETAVEEEFLIREFTVAAVNSSLVDLMNKASKSPGEGNPTIRWLEDG